MFRADERTTDSMGPIDISEMTGTRNYRIKGGHSGYKARSSSAKFSSTLTGGHEGRGHAHEREENGNDTHDLTGKVKS